MKLKNIKWSTIKLMFVSHVFGKTAAAIYKSYVYNCNTKNFLKAGEHITLVKPLYLIPQRIELGLLYKNTTKCKIIASKNRK